jgi:hypothetical protein
MSKELSVRQTILNYLTSLGEDAMPVTAVELSDAIGRDQQTVSSRLKKMSTAGEVCTHLGVGVRGGNGYTLPGVARRMVKAGLESYDEQIRRQRDRRRRDPNSF